MQFIVGFFIYFFLMIGIGLFFGKKVKNAEEYLVAKRRLPLFLAVPTVVATWFGAGSCLGVSGTVYEKGFLGVLADPFGCSLALILAGLFFAKKFRRENSYTIADILGKKYGAKIELASSILMLPFYIGTLASQMLAFGYIFHITLGIETTTGILIGSAIVLSYTIAGGMWAVSITDLFQLFFLFIGLVVILSITIQKTSFEKTLPAFFEEFCALVPKKMWITGWMAYLGKIFLTGLGAIMGQDLIQRFLACKDEKTAQTSAIASGILYFILGLIPLYVGLSGRLIYSSLLNPEQLMVHLSRDFLSSIAFYLFVAGIVSAIMSTADSYLLAGTSIFTQNILLKFIQPKNDMHHLLLMRFSNLFIAALSISVAFFSKSIFNLMVHSGATLFVSIFVPTTAALYMKNARIHSFSAWSSIFGGLIGWVLWIYFRKGGSLAAEENLFAAALFGFLVSLFSFFLPFFLRRIYLIFKIDVKMQG